MLLRVVFPRKAPHNASKHAIPATRNNAMHPHLVHKGPSRVYDEGTGQLKIFSWCSHGVSRTCGIAVQRNAIAANKSRRSVALCLPISVARTDSGHSYSDTFVSYLSPALDTGNGMVTEPTGEGGHLTLLVNDSARGLTYALGRLKAHPSKSQSSRSLFDKNTDQ